MRKTPKPPPRVFVARSSKPNSTRWMQRLHQSELDFLASLAPAGLQSTQPSTTAQFLQRQHTLHNSTSSHLFHLSPDDIQSTEHSIPTDVWRKWDRSTLHVLGISPTALSSPCDCFHQRAPGTQALPEQDEAEHHQHPPHSDASADGRKGFHHPS